MEGLWFDADWFKTPFGPSGNWFLPLEAGENAAFLPGGLGVIGEAAHSPPPDVSPTNFIVWIEVERSNPGSYLQDHYPEQMLGLQANNEVRRNHCVRFCHSDCTGYSPMCSPAAV